MQAAARALSRPATATAPYHHTCLMSLTGSPPCRRALTRLPTALGQVEQRQQGLEASPASPLWGGARVRGPRAARWRPAPLAAASACWTWREASWRRTLIAHPVLRCGVGGEGAPWQRCKAGSCGCCVGRPMWLLGGAKSPGAMCQGPGTVRAHTEAN